MSQSDYCFLQISKLEKDRISIFSQRCSARVGIVGTIKKGTFSIHLILQIIFTPSVVLPDLTDLQ